jgi:uncharacterized OB-fold protein
MNDLPFTQHAFNRLLDQEQLAGARCKACGHITLPPRPLCRACHQTDLAWQPMAGTGTLRTFTQIAVVPPAMAAQGYGRNNPYCSGVVELTEGCLVAARIVGIDANDPGSLTIGTPMRAVFLHPDQEREGPTVLAFEPEVVE